LVVIYKTILFFVAFVIAVVIFILIKNFILSPYGLIVEESSGESEFITFFTSTVFYKHGSITLIMSFLINFYFQIKRKMGKGVLFNLFMGKYHLPRQEERIIMFLDLTSATSIAEKLDLYKYSLFLQDFFRTIDDAISETKGAILQFVGDEVVILWKKDDGIEDCNCLRFFFLAQQKINERKNLFIQKYSLVPEFKAGLHYGKVIITEVGVSKQEIAYHGDTVNTAARIRSLCNSVGKRLLVSAELLTILSDIDKSYNIESIGISDLKGKKNVIGILSVEQK
jgi:adenylate cyclase